MSYQFTHPKQYYVLVLVIIATIALQVSRQISSLEKFTVPSFYIPDTIYQSHMIQVQFKQSTASPVNPKIQKASHFETKGQRHARGNRKEEVRCRRKARLFYSQILYTYRKKKNCTSNTPFVPPSSEVLAIARNGKLSQQNPNLMWFLL